MKPEDAIQILKEILDEWDNIPPLDRRDIWLEFAERVESLCETGKTS